MDTTRMRISLGLMAASLAPILALAADKKCELQQVGQLPVSMSDTRPVISGTVNGKPARFIADSGAFFSMVTSSSAERFALKPGVMPAGLSVRGVGGAANVSLAKASEFTLVGLAGGRVFTDVQFLVGSSAGAGYDGLIGQNVLGIADAEYDLANGAIRLFRPKDCSGSMLAYWQREGSIGELEIDPTTPASPHIVGAARINGRKIRVMFDSGAWRSVLNSATAKRVGIALEDQEVGAAGVAHGIGKQSIETYLARFDTLDIGGEIIKNARLRIGDVEVAKGADMLLGADFFLSHRIYMALKQRKIYFTYNGGPVFDLRRNSGERSLQAGNAQKTGDPAEAGASRSDVSAEALRLRGTASLARRDYERAISDLDQAIRVDPSDAESYYHRARAQWAEGKPQLAHDDATQAIALNPAHTQALMLRANIELTRNREVNAKADFDAALETASNPLELQLAIGRSYTAAGKAAMAIQYFDAWIVANPRNAFLGMALNDRCWARAVANIELELALQDCDAAMKKGDSNSMVLDSRAFVFLRMGKFDQAIKDYEAVLKLQPKQAWSLYGLGIAKLKKGSKQAGDRDIEAALAIERNVQERYRKMGVTL